MSPETPEPIVEAPRAVEVPVAKNDRLPPIKNKTQGMRLAKFLFGPLARIHFVNDTTVTIYVENGSRVTLLGMGADMKEALEDALQKVVGAQQAGKSLSADIMPVVPAVNLVEEKRHNLAIKLPDEETDTIEALHPNEVLEVSDLVQICPTDPTNPVRVALMAEIKFTTNKAKARSETRKLLAAAVAKFETGSVESKSDSTSLNLVDTNVGSGETAQTLGLV